MNIENLASPENLSLNKREDRGLPREIFSLISRGKETPPTIFRSSVGGTSQSRYNINREHLFTRKDYLGINIFPKTIKSAKVVLEVVRYETKDKGVVYWIKYRREITRIIKALSNFVSRTTKGLYRET